MDIWSFAFMQRALVAGLLTGLLCALVGFFVVLRYMSFVGAGISHSVFGGMALALWLGLPLDWPAMIFAVLLAWAIGYTSRHGDLHEDVTIGIFFAATMALGVLVVSTFTGTYVDLFSFLFGNILGVTNADLRLLVWVTAAVSLFIIFAFKELLFSAFDQDVATAMGVPVTWLYYALLTALAISIVASVKVVGIVLASAMLVLPAATGFQLSKNYRGMIAWSLVVGPLATTGGMVVSYVYGWPAGATIVLVAAGIFSLAFTFSPRRGFWSRFLPDNSHPDTSHPNA
ncbi:MAG: metal ABC transporter permease [Clostridia bacterium]|nr:MAG: metal ABC transporter permease [Clostridia bacterium]